MVFAQTDGIESVLLDHTITRGPSVARIRDFFPCYFPYMTYKILYGRHWVHLLLNPADLIQLLVDHPQDILDWRLSPLVELLAPPHPHELP